MGVAATVHGFRSTFADWAAEQTDFPREVREMAPAHAVGDRVEAAYRRGDLFEKRRRLAEVWSDFCASTSLRKSAYVVSQLFVMRAKGVQHSSIYATRY